MVNSLLYLAVINIKLNLLDKARVYSKAACIISPDNINACEIYAYSALLSGFVDEVEDILSKIDFDTNNTRYLKLRIDAIVGNFDCDNVIYYLNNK